MVRAAICSAPCSLAIIASIVAVGGLASVAPAAGDLQNAATWYQRAIQKAERMPESDRALLWNYDPVTHGPADAELLAALDRAQPLLNELRRGSLQSHADYGMPDVMRIDTPLPHLAGLRQVAKFANTDAIVRMQHGDSSGASERLAAIYRMSGHIGESGVVISSLVGVAVLALADHTIQYGIDHNTFDTVDHLTLLSAVDELASRPDPMNFIGGIEGDRDMVTRWMNEAWTLRQDDMDAAVEQIEMIFGRDSVPPFLLEIDESQFDRMLGAYNEYLDDVVDVFMMDDPDEARDAMRALEESMLDSPDYLFAQHLAPSYSHVLESALMAQATLEARLAMLKELVEGEIDSAQIANAAVWYLRGIEMLHNLDAEHLGTIRSFAFEADEPIDAAVAAAIQAARQAATIFHEGAEKRRCDFTIARLDGSHFLPSYAEGMRDAFRLLRAQAALHVADDDIEEAADQLEAMLRMVVHLAGDEQYVSGLIAHRALLDATELIEHAVENDLLTSEQRRMLAEVLDGFERGDPFRYAAALRPWRERLERRISRAQHRNPALPVADEDDQTDDERIAATAEQANEYIRRADDDTLFALLALDQSVQRARRGESPRVIDTHDPDGEDSDEATQSDPVDNGDADASARDESEGVGLFSTLGDVLHVEGVQAVWKRAGDIAEQVVGEHIGQQEHVFLIIPAEPIRLIALDFHRRMARRDVEHLRSVLLRDVADVDDER